MLFAQRIPVVFAGTRNGGVYISTTGGGSWRLTGSGLPGSYVAALTSKGNRLFAGTAGGGLLVSTNSGKTWTPSGAGLTTQYIYSFTVKDKDIFAGTNSGVFLSTDNGESWVSRDTVLRSYSIGAMVFSGPTIFAAAGNHGCFRSSDYGLSWSAVSIPIPSALVYALAVVPNQGNPDNNVILAGTEGSGVFRSTNKGASWTQINLGLTHVVVNAFCRPPSLPEEQVIRFFSQAPRVGSRGPQTWAQHGHRLTPLWKDVSSFHSLRSAPPLWPALMLECSFLLTKEQPGGRPTRA